MKSVTFDNCRGFALGYDEAAPSPFVTWQFTETENGQRDYYWGHYHSDGQTAEKDFAKRIDDYKELFQVQERTSGREPAEYYRYYSTQRPVDLGTFPKPPGNAPVEIINFDERRMVEGGTMRAWGELAYLKPLTESRWRTTSCARLPAILTGRPGPLSRPSSRRRPVDRRPPRSPTRPNTTSPMRTDKEDAMNEKDNYLHTAELSEEQNDNMLDGILNNLPPSPLPKGPEKKELDRVKEPPAHKRSREREER